MPLTQPGNMAIILLVGAHVGRIVAEALRPTNRAAPTTNTAPQQQKLGKRKNYEIYELPVVKGFSG